MRKIVLAVVATVSLLVGGLSAGTMQAQAAAPSYSGPETVAATGMVSAATSVGNMLGKPLPKLDYVHTMVGGKMGSVPKRMPTAPPKLAPKTPCGTCFFYLGGKQVVSTNGASDQATVEQPTCTTHCWHTLFELAVQSANTQQVVEWGYNIDPSVNGDLNPHLFVFYWVNGSPMGYNTNWTPAIGSTCPAGMDISADVSVGSATKQLFGVQYLSGAWWMSYKGNYCGAFAGSLWTSPTYTQAGQIQVFDELATDDTAPTGAQMGSGVLATTTAGAKRWTFTLGTTVPAGVTPSLTLLSAPAPTHFNRIFIAPTVTRSFNSGGTY